MGQSSQQKRSQFWNTSCHHPPLTPRLPEPQFPHPSCLPRLLYAVRHSRKRLRKGSTWSTHLDHHRVPNWKPSPILISLRNKISSVTQGQRKLSCWKKTPQSEGFWRTPAHQHRVWIYNRHRQLPLRFRWKQTGFHTNQRVHAENIWNHRQYDIVTLAWGERTIIKLLWEFFENLRY